ncbi:hypothetical protein KASIA_p002 [Shewanella phage vB_SspS_KASIA]|nr:hypothetical protein KASIA_p002 [Shewanella phage vB_SspS_KASIA]
MNTYYQVTAINKSTGNTEVMYGSFDKKDCKDEIECERDSWRDSGYKSFKIDSIQVEESPDEEIYALATGNELWMSQAPNFNFELDEPELIAKGLEVGFITQPDPTKDLYIINTDY